MRSSLYLFALILFFSHSTFSQSSDGYDIGILGGGTITQHKILDSMGFRTGSESLGIGYAIGLFYMTSEPGFGFETNLLFTQRSSVPASIGTQEIQYTLKNIEIPVIGFYRWDYFQVGLGPYFLYGVGTVKINGGPLVNSNFSYSKLQLHQHELGMTAQLGTKFDTGMGFVTLEVRYNRGLTNRAKYQDGLQEFSSQSYDMLLGMAF